VQNNGAILGKKYRCSLTDEPVCRAPADLRPPLPRDFANTIRTIPDYFNAAMGNLSGLAADELTRVYDFSKSKVALDVGGAHGVLLAAVLRANPNLSGILFDLPHVIETAGSAIADQGIAERCADSTFKRP
jgi:hypothetical protein